MMKREINNTRKKESLSLRVNDLGIEKDKPSVNNSNIAKIAGQGKSVFSCLNKEQIKQDPTKQKLRKIQRIGKTYVQRLDPCVLTGGGMVIFKIEKIRIDRSLD